MTSCHGGLAAPGAIAVPNATNELARVDTERPPDHELTHVLPARTGRFVPGKRPFLAGRVGKQSACFLPLAGRPSQIGSPEGPLLSSPVPSWPKIQESSSALVARRQGNCLAVVPRA
jgi:hypothetical protein